MNKGLLFAVALSLCFLNQLRPMCNNNEKLEELYSSIKKLKTDTDDLNKKNNLGNTFDLLYDEMHIASKKAFTLLKTNTIKNQDIRCDEILKLHKLLFKLLNEWTENKYIEMVKKDKESLDGVLALKEKYLLEQMITCLKDMIEKLDSIIKEIEG